MGISHNKDFFYYEKSYNTKEILTKKNNKFLWLVKDNNILISSTNVNVTIERNVDICRKYMYKRLLCLYCDTVLDKNELSDNNKIYINKKIKEYNKYNDKFLMNKNFIHYYKEGEKKVFYNVMSPQCSCYTKYTVKNNKDIKYFYVSKEANKKEENIYLKKLKFDYKLFGM